MQTAADHFLWLTKEEQERPFQIILSISWYFPYILMDGIDSRSNCSIPVELYQAVALASSHKIPLKRSTWINHVIITLTQVCS